MNDKCSYWITDAEQNTIKGVKVLFAGAGLGGITAKCALRFGFETIRVVDEGSVKELDLSNQIFIRSDIGKSKSSAIAERLIEVNPNARVEVVNEFVTKDNVDQITHSCNIAINTLDARCNDSLLFDKICQLKGIYVLRPYDLGFGGLLTVVSPGGLSLTEISTDNENIESGMLDHIIKYSRFWNIPIHWLEELIKDGKKSSEGLNIPQTSIGAWIAAGFCVNAMYNIATKKPVLHFPKFYLSSMLNGTY